MADNFVSYNRFTALPPNIADFGATVEELNLQKGQPDPNPVLSPMPSPRVPEARLALSREGSDKLRLGSPAQPDVNPYEGQKSNLVQSRNVVRKLGSNVFSEISKQVGQPGAFDQNLQSLMSDSLRRVQGLREYMAHLNAMTESVYAKSLSASKG